MLNLKMRSLRTKFPFTVAFILLIIFTFASYIRIVQTTQVQKTSLIADAKTFADFATTPLGDAYGLYHNSGILKLNGIFSKTLSQNTIVPRVQIISVNGDILFDSNSIGPTDSQTNTTESKIVDPIVLNAVAGNNVTQLKDEKGEITGIIVPYSDSFGSRPYSLRYFVSYDSIDAAVNQAIWTTLLINIILFLVTFVAVTFLVNRSILSPLSKLAMFAKAIGHGDFDYPLEIKSGDELESLAIDYRYMASNVKAEKAAIVAEKDTLSLVLGNIADGVAALDAGCSLLLLNNAAGKILDLNKDESIGKTIDEFITFKDKETKVTIAHLCQQSQSKPSYFSLHFDSKNGEMRKINVIIAPLMHASESNIRFIITFYDLTKEEEFEKMKLDFVSMAAHELRTPITAIRGYLGLLADAVKGKINAAEDEFIQRCIVSSDQLYILVKNLLDISNIEKGRMSINLEPVNLEKKIENLVETLSSNARQHKVFLSFEKPQTPVPFVMADDLGVNEVLANLINNAINYNKAGGFVKITLEEKDKSVIVSVIDNGVGIAEASIPHLFTKFYRVTAPLLMGAKGTGLGLFISKKIIDASQGKIWVKSQLNQGSTFSFSLQTVQNKS